jgi:Leucine-rich repeat (LRR) protein
MWSLVLLFFAGKLGSSNAIRCNGTNMKSKLGEHYLIDYCQSEILRDEDTSLKGIQYIVAEGNLIKALDNTTFKDGESLGLINLNYNQIETIQIGTFDKTKNLTHLYLRNNKISNLKPGVFQGLVNLKILWLQANQIRILKNGLFRDQKEFKELFFNDNQISMIESNVFSNFVKLQLVNFGGNFCFTRSFQNISGDELTEKLANETEICLEKFISCEKSKFSTERKLGTCKTESKKIEHDLETCNSKLKKYRKDSRNRFIILLLMGIIVLLVKHY